MTDQISETIGRTQLRKKIGKAGSSQHGHDTKVQKIRYSTCHICKHQLLFTSLEEVKTIPHPITTLISHIQHIYEYYSSRP